MLSPRERALLFQSLRPPIGYRLDRAIGTSYTLDLLALLTAPLAFAFHDWENADGRPTSDPVALLHALRQHARRITLFCQAGSIKAPGPGQPLFTYLEPSIVEARAPTEGGIFHPKVWVLRYTAPDEPVRYRALVASRNLTFDQSWDTLLTLDGELSDRKRSIARNHPLSDFVAALPTLAVRPVARDVRRDIEKMADEIRRVHFDLPEHFDDLRFHPIGISGYEEHWPLASGGRKCLVVSPFLTDRLLDELVAECEAERNADRVELHLVSRSESLRGLRQSTIARWPNRWILAADTEPEDAEAHLDSGQTSTAPTGATSEFLSGLHAKLFILHRHRRAHVFTGSANATSAAFERNVEFMVEMVGGFHRVGIPSLLGSPDEAGSGKLGDLLEPWEPTEIEVDPELEVREALRRKLEVAQQSLGLAALTLHLTPLEGAQEFDLVLRGDLPALPDGVTAKCWPASRSRHHAVEPAAIGDLAEFRALAPVELTAFLAFELTARGDGCAETARFARHLPLDGAPDDREEHLLQDILKDKETVLRLLWILLSSDELAAEDLGLGAGGNHFNMRHSLGGMPVLEAMVRALARDPDALASVQKLIEDLGRTDEGRALLPDGLDSIWGPICAAREELRR